MTEPAITRHQAEGASDHTFDLTIDGARRGYLDYSLPDAATMVIHFVEVDPKLRGQSMGKRLVGAAIEWARANGRQVVPKCWYARSVIENTPEYQDVLVGYFVAVFPSPGAGA
jgi:predicted GNAT family acetyltransferase